MSDFNWVFFVSKRLAKVDRKGRTAVTSWIASVGVCIGVMALIVVMAVMNGFQMSFKDSIMEISSYHVRVSNVSSDRENEFLGFCSRNNALCTVEFHEAQGLMVSRKGLQTASFIRAVPENINQIDKGFARELKIISGKFDLSKPDYIIVGNTIAYNLGLRRGSKVNIAALSGSSDRELLSENREFTVTGIFFCGYADINAGYSFVSSDAARKYFSMSRGKSYGIKLKSENRSYDFAKSIAENFPDVEAVTWQNYNRSFFGVLRMEKIFLFIVVMLIFLVVAINIFNSMRRLVYERKDDIAVLSALGGNPRSISNVFLLQGLKTGVLGAVPGLLLGLAVSQNISALFRFASDVTGNSMFLAYARIPARNFPSEVAMIFLFGLLSAFLASLLAGRNVLKMTVAEVLRDE